jgi:hypothetical protein
MFYLILNNITYIAVYHKIAEGLVFIEINLCLRQIKKPKVSTYLSSHCQQCEVKKVSDQAVGLLSGIKSPTSSYKA